MRGPRTTLIKVSTKRVMGLCIGELTWRAQMHAGISIHQLSPPPPVQHVPSDTAQMRRRVLAHAPCLDFEPWGPPQVCCRFGAVRQLGWCAASCSILCLSPLTLPGRILVVLCDQEKPQLFISSKVCLVLWATVFFCPLHKTLSMPPSHLLSKLRNVFI